MGVSFSLFDRIETILFSGIVVYLGLVLGSFSTALIYRLPNNLSWIYDRQLGSPRSACPSCRTLLRVWDLIPIVSWLFLKGRCRYCGAQIGGIYPLVEALCLAGCVGIFIAQGLNMSSFLIMLAMPFLVALGVIDIENRKMASSLIPILAVLGAIRALWISIEADSLAPGLDRLAGGILFLTVAWVIGALLRALSGDRMASADHVKVFGMAGIWLGAGALWAFLIGAMGVGVLFFVLWKLIKRHESVPQGAALALALYVVLTLNAGP